MHIKIELINHDNWNSHKILEVLFSITPNGQNKHKYSKKTPIWNRLRLSLGGKKIIVNNQTLFSKF